MEDSDQGTSTPTPIDYSNIPTGRLGPSMSGGTASLVITPSLENGGTIGLHVFENVGGNSWPMPVHHGRAVQLGKLGGHSGESVVQILREHEVDLRQIDAAYQGTRWNGNNNVGVWAGGNEFGEDDSNAPIERLEEALSEADTYWDASEYLGGDLHSTMRDCYQAMADGSSLSEVAQAEVEAAIEHGALIDQEEVERFLQSELDDEDPGINLVDICARRYAALLAAGKSPEEAEQATREVLPADRRANGVVREGRFVLKCECGIVDGEPCYFDLERSDEIVVVEWMPQHLRASHEAAGNSGLYPHNGAQRLVCYGPCAENLCENDEWAHVVKDQ